MISVWIFHPNVGSETAKEMRGIMYRKRLTKAMATVMLSVTMAVGTMPAMPVFAQENVSEETQITADVSQDESADMSDNTVTDEVTEGASDSTIPEKATDIVSDDTKAVGESTDATDITDAKDKLTVVSEKPVTEEAKSETEEVSVLKTAGDTVWQNDYDYSLNEGDHTISLKKYTGSSSDITVPAKAIINGTEYGTVLVGEQTTYSSHCFDLNVTSFAVENGVKIDCIFGASRNNPNTTVESIDLRGGELLTTVMYNMFGDCRNLKKVNISGIDTSKVTTMGHMFSGCCNLEEIQMTGIDTGNVTDMTEMFGLLAFDKDTNQSIYNRKLERLDVSQLNTQEVRKMRNMFMGCAGLKSLDLSHMNTGNVESMYGMFDGCASLTSLDLSSLNTGSVTTMDGMFMDCQSLESLDLRSLNTSNVTDMRSMFWGCRNLKSVNISGIDTSKVTTMYNMFGCCYNLEEVLLTGIDTSNVTDMSRMFWLDGSDTTAYKPNIKLERLDISQLNTQKVENMEYMFKACAGLKTLDLSHMDTSSVTNMHGMFRECANLEELDFSSFDTSNVTNMEEMFAGCSRLKSLDLSKFNTSKVTNMEYMFGGDSSLTELDLSSFDVSNVTSMSHMFSNAAYLSEDGETVLGNIRTIKTPKNLKVSVDLPYYCRNENNRLGTIKYYDEAGNEYTSLPKNLDHSITLRQAQSNGSDNLSTLAIKSASYDASKRELSYVAQGPKDMAVFLYEFKEGVLIHRALHGMPSVVPPKFTVSTTSGDFKWYILVVANQNLATEFLGATNIGMEESGLVNLINSKSENEVVYKTGSYSDEIPDGLKQESDGSWSLYLNGKVATDFTDLYCDTNVGWWLVSNGKVDFGYNGLFGSDNYGWWKINGGAVDFGYSDLYDAPDYGWWKISGGAVDFGFTGAYESPTYGAWMIEAGRVTGPANSSGGNTGINGLAPASDGTWYLYDNGQVASGYSALYYDENYGWWLIDNGRVAFDYNGLYCDPTLGWWLITGGAVNFEYNDLYGDANYGWWKISGGAVDFGFTDLYCSNTYGWWLVEGGAVAFGYDDLFGSPIYGWWKVTGGAVDFGFTDLFCSPSCGWWLVNGGAVAFGYTDLFYSPTYGWWKINDGCVDFGYNGLYNSPTFGEWNISGGAVIF